MSKLKDVPAAQEAQRDEEEEAVPDRHRLAEDIRKFFDSMSTMAQAEILNANLPSMVHEALESLKAHDAQIQEAVLGGASNSSTRQSSRESSSIFLETVKCDLRRQHCSFAGNVFDYLLKYYGLRSLSFKQNDNCYYDEFVGEAVLSLCMLYGDQWRKVFDDRNVYFLQPKLFVLHCSKIPVERDENYYFNYLIRIALIFEMAVYCFERDYDYFEVAKKCTYRFVDLLFFRDEGNWSSLKNAASVITIVTRPLRFAINCPKDNVRSFADVIRLLGEFRSNGVINFSKREITLLKNLEEKFFPSLPASKKGSLQSEPPQNQEDLVQTLMTYFRGCLPKNYPTPLEAFDNDVDEFVISSEFCLSDTMIFRMILEIEEKSIQKGESLDEQLEDGAKGIPVGLLSDLLWADKILDLLRIRRRLNLKMRRMYHLKEEETTQSRDPRGSTGTITKKKTQGGKNRKYFPLHKKYLRQVIELYAQVLPSFLRHYSRLYLAPSYQPITVTGSEVFLVNEEYYERRSKILNNPDAWKRMWGSTVLNDDYQKGKIETSAPQVVPINLQKSLDLHVQGNAKELMPDFAMPMFSVPKIQNSFGSSPPWSIKGSLDKDYFSLIEPFIDMGELVGSLKDRLFRTTQEEFDEVEVQKFRFKTSLGGTIRLPQHLANTVPDNPTEPEAARQNVVDPNPLPERSDRK